jgi:ElaB/YqjD/DUF883 family membrane-anchored ribosome-binding protein
MTMPNEEKLEYEITLARQDLESNIQDLKAAVTDELDIAKQAHKVIDKVKTKASQVVEQKQLEAKLFLRDKLGEAEAVYAKARAKIVANPETAIAVGLGAAAVIVGGVLLYRKLS